MQRPCECWDGGQWADGAGRAICGMCGAKYNRKLDKYADETSAQEVARFVAAKMAKKREAQRVVDTNSTACQKTDCAWWSKLHSQNCYRDAGDCRYSEA
jgi:hypothetical protein